MIIEVAKEFALAARPFDICLPASMIIEMAKEFALNRCPFCAGADDDS